MTNFAGMPWAGLYIFTVLVAADSTHAQCKAIFFDPSTYTTSGGTQGAGSIIGQDPNPAPANMWAWQSGGTSEIADNTVISISANEHFSGTQAVLITSAGGGGTTKTKEATKSFTGCGTTADTGLISVRLKFKKGIVNPNVGTLIKPQVLDDASAVFGFFQINGNGTMKGRGGAQTDVNTDTVDPDIYGIPPGGWHDLEMRLNPSQATIVDPGSGVSIPFGKVLYLINGNPLPATGMTGAVHNENPMVYYGGSNTSGKVGRFTLRRETTAGPSDNATVYLDNWEVWNHPRPIAKAHTVTVTLNGSGNASVTGANIDDSSLGGDPSQSITNRTATPSSFTCSNIGSNSVTLTVTQSDGQTAQAVTTVTVQDTTPPNITSCGNHQSTNSVDANCQAAVPNFTSTVTATDNCTASGSLTKTQSPVAGTLVYPGITVVTITVKDAQNNQAQCPRNFTVNAPDTDGDGTPDCDDGCPNDPNKITPGTCGCGIADTDSDGDGIANCQDGCPNDPAKITPGICGCGTPDTDSDGDGTPDCDDGCPSDPLKTTPGLCGCNVPETDSDGDGTPDCQDGCPNDPNKIVPGQCGCGVPEGTCARTITQWRSVRTHTGAGDLAIILNPTASGNGASGPTVETRGTAALGLGIRNIQVDFSGPVTLINPANISVVGQTTSGDPATLGSPVAYVPTSVTMADADTLDIFFDVNVLPNQTCYTIAIGPGTFSQTLVGDIDVMVRSLYCDTNGSGTVSVADTLSTKSKNGQPVTSNVQHDVNLSGAITIGDMLADKAQVTSPAKSALCP